MDIYLLVDPLLCSVFRNSALQEYCYWSNLSLYMYVTYQFHIHLFWTKTVHNGEILDILEALIGLT